MEELETIEMIIEDDNINPVYALSLVDNPATQDQTVLLSEEKQSIKLSEVLEGVEVVQLAEVSSEKQLIMGLVLEPNTKIPRKKENGDLYNITFKPETVVKASHLYMANLNNNNATVDHKEEIEGVSTVESWVVEDTKLDKSAIYGKEYNVGSWAVILKVHDTKQWEEFKENGTTNISLEGIFTPKEQATELSKIDELSSLWDKVINK